MRLKNEQKEIVDKMVENTPKPFIPSFITNKTLDTPDNVISYLLNYYVFVPSAITNNYRDMEVSLHKDIALAGNDNDRLRELIIESLTTLITTYYPNYSMLDIDVDFIPDDPKNPQSPNVTIEISISALIDNVPINLSLAKSILKQS